MMKILCEYCACDCFKVIARCCDRLVLSDRLQFEDILAAIKCELEYSDKRVYKGSGSRSPVRGRLGLPSRKRMPRDFADNWTSDDNYTRTTGNPCNAGEALRVIVMMAEQLVRWDGLTLPSILAIIESDLNRHYVEYDV